METTTTTPALYLGDRVAWDGDRLVVTDDELLGRVNRPYLSASTSKAMHSCPARMVAERAMPSGFDLFGAAELGTATHTVLERLYTLPPGRRDRQHSMAILTELAAAAPQADDDVDYAKKIGSDPVRHTQWIASVSRSFGGIFDIEDPRDVRVHSTELHLDDIEVAGVPFKGFVDRVDELPDGRLRVIDYKGLALDTPIPTPAGWTTMGALNVGEKVFGAAGAPVTVTGKSQVHHRPCYRIMFSDGSSVICDNVHLWQVDDGTLEGVTVDADTLHGLVTAGRVRLVTSAVFDRDGDGVLVLVSPDGAHHSVMAVEPVVSVPTQCIEVDAPDALYLCGPLMVPTHNSGRDKSKVNKFYDDDHGDQILLYVEALTVKFGEKPGAGHLYYVTHGKQRRVAISNTDVNKTKRKFTESWEALKKASASREFTTKLSPLCGWCPLVNSCPTAGAGGMTDRKGGAPTAVDLGIPSLLPDGTTIPFVDGRSKWADVAQAPGAAHMPCEEEPPPDPKIEGNMMSSTGKKWHEAKPYDGSDIDGHLSLNSYASTAVFGLSSLAAEQLFKAGRKVGPSPVKAVAALLASTVLDAQDVLTNGSRDWQEGSNTRLRGLLRTVLDIIPLPFGGDTEAWQTWSKRAHGFMVAVSATAVDLYNNGPVIDLDALVSIESVTVPVQSVRDAA